MTTWMDFEGIMRSEMRRIEKDKYYMISLSGGILKRKKRKKNSYKKKSDLLTKVGGGRRGNWRKVVKGTNFQL